METSQLTGDPLNGSVESASSTSVNESAKPHSLLDKFGQAVLDSHNEYRQLHCCPPLHWSDGCTKLAQTLAEYMALNNTLKTYTTQGYGQNTAFFMNLSLSGSLDQKHISIMDSVVSDKLLAQYMCEVWYREGQNYSFVNPGFNTNGCVTSHFTQMLWKGTKEVGVAKLTRDGRTFAVAVYKPQGNVSGEFEANVLRRPCNNASQTD